jgi:hypothetical protein
MSILADAHLGCRHLCRDLLLRTADLPFSAAVGATGGPGGISCGTQALPMRSSSDAPVAMSNCSEFRQLGEQDPATRAN